VARQEVNKGWPGFSILERVMGGGKKRSGRKGDESLAQRKTAKQSFFGECDTDYRGHEELGGREKKGGP